MGPLDLRRGWWLMPLASLLALWTSLLMAGRAGLDWSAILIGAVLIGLTVNYPIPGAQGEANLAHAISLTLGFAHGPGAMALALVVGLTAGETVRAVWRGAPAPRGGSLLHRAQASILAWSVHTISPFASLAVYRALGGGWLASAGSLPSPGALAASSVVFVGLFLVHHSLNHRLLAGGSGMIRVPPGLALIAALPIPFAALTASAYARLGISALMVFGGAATVISPILRSLAVAEGDLRRRLRELSTFGRVSQVMGTSLDLEEVLDTIYLQVADLLRVDNFYIALYDGESDELTYPLAIKGGRRQDWPARALTDRLTDRVIRSGAPLLLPHDAPRQLEALGLPDREHPPEAWIGVPLVNAGRVTGCLAVFHLQPGAGLSTRDLEILTTIAGQAAAVIDNALLYQQTRRRAEALASLNEITAWMSSTLDPERTLELVGLSVIRVGGAQKSALFLVDDDREHLTLARGTNLSAEFTAAWSSLPLSDQERTVAYHRRVPVLVADVEGTGTGSTDQTMQVLRAEGVRAYADFPLATPSGVIGQLSVFFSEPQRFPADQVELLRTFASQAALAVANARAHAETDQALRRRVAQLATLEAIGRAMASTLEPDRLYDALLSYALSATSAERGHLSLHDAERKGLRVVAQRGFPAHWQAGRLLPLEGNAVGEAFRTGLPQIVMQAVTERGKTDYSPGLVRSLLSLPIIHQERCLGVLTLESPRVSAFSLEDQQFLAQLAAQAGVALFNAHLVEQLEARLREQSLLYQASAQIAATLESQAVAQAAADALRVALRAGVGCLSRWDAEAAALELQVDIGETRPHQALWRRVVPAEQAPAIARALQDGRPVQWSEDSAPTEADRIYLASGRVARSILAVPMMAGEEVLGLLEALDSEARVFDEAELRTAQTIAAQTAIAIQNTDLFRRIRESHERLMAVLNSTQEGMLMVDATGRVLLSNPQLEALTGLSGTSLHGVRLSDPGLRAPECLGYRPGELAGLLSALVRGQAPPHGTARYDVEAPARRSLQRTETPVRDAGGELVGWLVVVSDITEDRKLEEARRQLTEMIVHDLRSPLTAILASLKVLGEAGGKAAIGQQALTVAGRAVQQMLLLVDSLLDIAKLEAGEMQLALQPTSIEGVCRDLLPPFVQEANEHGVLLHQHIHPDLPVLQLDGQVIGRVLSNLLDNALKFTPAGGRIDLRIEAAGDGVRLSVADSGPGIPLEFRDRIFERFGQVPGTLGRRHGTGLGLAFSKLAVEAHGGRIWVEDNPGGGTIFCAVLPSDPDLAAASSGGPPDPGQA